MARSNFFATFIAVFVMLIGFWPAASIAATSPISLEIGKCRMATLAQMHLNLTQAMRMAENTMMPSGIPLPKGSNITNFCRGFVEDNIARENAVKQAWSKAPNPQIPLRKAPPKRTWKINWDTLVLPLLSGIGIVLGLTAFLLTCLLWDSSRDNARLRKEIRSEKAITLSLKKQRDHALARAEAVQKALNLKKANEETLTAQLENAGKDIGVFLADLAETREHVTNLTAERDAAQEEVTTLTAKLRATEVRTSNVETSLEEVIPVGLSDLLSDETKQDAEPEDGILSIPLTLSSARFSSPSPAKRGGLSLQFSIRGNFPYGRLALDNSIFGSWVPYKANDHDWGVQLTDGNAKEIWRELQNRGIDLQPSTDSTTRFFKKPFPTHDSVMDRIQTHLSSQH